MGLRDERVVPPFSAHLVPIEFELKNFSNVGHHAAHYNMKLQSDAGETLIGNGEFSVNPVNFKTRFALDNLPPSRYASYYHEYFRGQLDGGMLQFSGELLFSKKEGGELELQLQDLECGLSDIKINSPDGEPVFVLPLLKIAKSRIRSKQERVRAWLFGRGKGSFKS